jgi:GAF domain-containing protein
LARDQVLLEQKQRRVIHDLSNAYSDVIRTFEIANVTMNQRLAAYEQLALLRNLEENNSRVNTNDILDAQNRVSLADAVYYDAIVEFMIAIKNIHFEKGTLLEYNNIAFVDRIRSTRNVTRLVPISERTLNNYMLPADASVPESLPPPPLFPSDAPQFPEIDPSIPLSMPNRNEEVQP